MSVKSKILLSCIFSTACQIVFAASNIERCPESNTIYHYVETNVFPKDTTKKQKMSIFYFLTEAYDSSKPVLLYLNGGPGDYTMPANAKPFPDYNVVYMHHRGVGCSKVLSDYRPIYTEPYFSIDYAANDLEEVRKDLLGENGKWFVYGISYGGILAQTYALENSKHIEGLILDSTFFASNQITFARNQFLDLFFPIGSDVQKKFQQVLSKYPETKIDILRLAAYSGSYKLRAIYFPQVLQNILDASSLTEALKILAQFRTPLYPKVGMAREITCREMWDYPLNNPVNEFYLPGVDDDCKAFRDFRVPFDYSGALKNLNVKAMIWGGKYDLVAPLESMKKMSQWIDGSLLWANMFSGHGLIREKPECAKKLLSLFAKRASDSDIKTEIQSELCQSAPKIDSFAKMPEFEPKTWY